MTVINSNFSIKSCIYCGSRNEIISDGFLLCPRCGTTKGRQFVDHLPVKSNNGVHIISHNSIGKNLGYIGTLGSNIGHSNGYLRGHRGQKLKSNIVLKYRRLIKYHHDRARIDGNTTHLRTMLAFNRVFGRLQLSNDIKQRSLFLYWKHSNTNHKITNHVLLIALCLLQSIREASEKAPVRFSEVVNVFAENGHRVTNKNILRLARELNVQLSSHRRTAEDYIERIASQVRWNQAVIKRVNNRPIDLGQYELILVKCSYKFLSLLDRKTRGGVQPYPFAVSIVYLADRVYSKVIKRKPILTQKILAEAANSAEFTIRDHVYRFLGGLYKNLEEELAAYAHGILT